MAAKRKRDAHDAAAHAARAAPNPMANNEFPSYDIGSHDDSNIEFALLSGDSVDDHGHGGHGDHSNAATAAAAIAQYHTMTVPQSTEAAFLKDVHEAANNDRPTNSDISRHGRNATFAGFDGDTRDHGADMSPTYGPGGTKPTVGSEEWHRVRKDNHKEVERRRRETINEGINELAKIVPGCEKNKGSILQRAVQFITQLKDNEQSNIEKWSLEKLLSEQAIVELSSSCDKLKNECQRAWAECERWKKAAEKAGVEVAEVDKEGED